MPFYLAVDRRGYGPYMEAILTCDCQALEEGIGIAYDDDLKMFLLYPSQAYTRMGWRQRIRQAWATLWGTDEWADDLMVSADTAKAFAEWLLARPHEEPESTSDRRGKRGNYGSGNHRYC